MTVPPIDPPEPQPAPPQIIYIQAPQQPTGRAVAGGIGIAVHWILIVVIGVPVLCCAGFLLIGALGSKH